MSKFTSNSLSNLSVIISGEVNLKPHLKPRPNADGSASNEKLHHSIAI